MSKPYADLEDITFGVELETHRPTDVEGRIGGYHNGVAVPWANCGSTGYNRKKWTAERDGSIHGTRSGYVGCEYVSPIMKGEKGLENLMKFVDLLKERGHRVNRSCGVHIHLGLKSIVGENASPDDVVAFLAQLNKYVFNWQDALFGQTGTRRGEMTYSARMQAGENMVERIKTISEKPKGTKTEQDIREVGYASTRYRAVNLTNMTRGNSSSATIEFRFGAGTLNPNKLLMHFASCVFMARLAWKTRHNKRDAVSWELNKGYHRRPAKAGVRGVKFLSRRMNSARAGYRLKEESAVMADRWDRMHETALEMARKYDSRCPNR
ncbi:MAG: hypothetical protein CMF45_08905 [Legionellales bacterium]|nr:hypothetical protein [Legionellales bacterium]